MGCTGARVIAAEDATNERNPAKMQQQLPRLLGSMRPVESARHASSKQGQCVKIWQQKMEQWYDGEVNKVYPNGDLAITILNQPTMSSVVVPAGLLDQWVRTSDCFKCETAALSTQLK